MGKKDSGKRYLVADADSDNLIIKAIHSSFGNLVKTAASPEEALSRIREVETKHHTIDCILWDLELKLDTLKEAMRYAKSSKPEVYVAGSRVNEPEYRQELEAMKRADIITDYFEDKSLYRQLLQVRIAATQHLPKK